MRIRAVGRDWNLDLQGRIRAVVVQGLIGSFTCLPSTSLNLMKILTIGSFTPRLVPEKKERLKERKRDEMLKRTL